MKINNFDEIIKRREEFYDSEGYQESLEKDRKNWIDIFTKGFGMRLKKIRKDKNLTQKEVAMILGVKISTYANWEQGRREPSIYDLWKIIVDLNVSPDDLFKNLLEEK